MASGVRSSPGENENKPERSGELFKFCTSFFPSLADFRHGQDGAQLALKLNVEYFQS